MLRRLSLVLTLLGCSAIARAGGITPIVPVAGVVYGSPFRTLTSTTAVTIDTTTARLNVVNIKISGTCTGPGCTTGSGTAWGTITGTLSNQTDLQGDLTAIGVSTGSLQSQITGLPSTYLTSSSATATYLQNTTAANVYLSTTNAANTYLTQNVAASNYLLQATAASTYLTQSSATATYLQPSTANATYLSQSSATATYFQKGTIIPVSSGGTGTSSPGLIAGTNITSITGTWPNQTINATTQSGGSGGSSIAFSTGSTAGYTGPIISSPTKIALFDQNYFAGTLLAGGTYFTTILPSTFTLQGNTFNGNSQLVQTTAGGALPSLSAANLTGVPGANITGTIPAASLTNAILNQGTLQANSVFNTASGTVVGPFSVTGSSGISNTYGIVTGSAVVNNLASGVVQADAGHHLLIQNVSLASQVSGSLPLSNLAAGTLPTNVVASSVAPSSIYPNMVTPGTYILVASTAAYLSSPANMPAGSLPSNVIASSLAATSGSIAAGTNVTVTGNWPNQTVAAQANIGLPLPGGATNYAQITNSLQAGATIYIASGTIQNLTASTITIVGPNAGGAIWYAQGATPVGVAGADLIYADPTTSNLFLNNNAGTPGQVLISTTASQTGCAQYSVTGELIGTGLSCGTGSGTGGGIVSPGTFTWTNNGYGIAVSTINGGIPIISTGSLQSGTTVYVSSLSVSGTMNSGGALITGSALTLSTMSFTVTAASSTFNGNVGISSGVLLNGSAGTNGQVLTSGGAGTIPSWTTVSGGGGGASFLAVGTGTTSGWTGTIESSPTAVVLMNNGQFSSVLQGGATNFVSALSSSFTLQGNSFNGTSQLVQTNGSGQLPVLSAANLTNFPSSLAQLASTQTFSATQVFTSSAIFSGGFTAGGANLIISSGMYTTFNDSVTISIVDTNNKNALGISTLGGINVVDISTNGHINAQATTASTVTSCGSAPAFSGSDIAGVITTGSGSPTSCTFTFAKPFTNTPVCTTATNSTSSLDDIGSISNSSITFGLSAALSNGKIYFICIGSD